MIGKWESQFVICEALQYPVKPFVILPSIFLRKLLEVKFKGN